MPQVEKMCQSLHSSLIKSSTNKLSERPPIEWPPSVDGASKVRSTCRPTMAEPVGRSGPTINYDCLDKRRSWITLNWIILFSTISELFNFSSPSAGRRNMLRFCNLNKINSSFSLFIYILITSSLINTSTIGKLNSLWSAFWSAFHSFAGYFHSIRTV